MSILDRYLAASFAKGLFLVTLVLIPLFTLLDFVQQLDDVGQGTYSLWDAVDYELQLLPRRVLDLLPVIGLFANTLALGTLGHHSELMAMQASGISVARVAGAIMKSALIVMIAALACDEWVASRMHQTALQKQSLAISGTVVVQRADGFWIHQGQRFVNVGSFMHGQIPADIDILQFDDERRLMLYIHAAYADIIDAKNWTLKDVVRKRNEAGRLVTDRVPEMTWESYVSPREVKLLELPAYSMAPSQLWAYVDYLRSKGQRTFSYEQALWEKLSLPLSTGAMILLSVPFAFGSPRSRSSGRRALLAVIAGVAYFVGTQVLSNAGSLLSLSPSLTAFIPVTLVVLVTLLLYARRR